MFAKIREILRKLMVWARSNESAAADCDMLHPSQDPFVPVIC